jgi:chaperone BCS1
MANLNLTTDLVPVASPENPSQLWPEPLDTPGVLPRHLKRAANTQFPLLEVLQRFLFRFRLNGDLEKVLAAIALFNAARPVYKHLREFVLWAFTVDMYIPEGDAVAKDVMTWMSEKVVQDSRSRSVMMVTGGLQSPTEEFPLPSRYMMGRSSSSAPGAENVSCLPPIGSRIFW